MQRFKLLYQRVFYFNVFCFLALLFLSLGVDTKQLIQLRVVYFLLIVFFSLPIYGRPLVKVVKERSNLVFLGLILFLMLRAMFSHFGFFALGGAKHYYLNSLGVWSIFFGCFIFFQLLATKKNLIRKLSWFISIICVFIAINAMPELLSGRKYPSSNYVLELGEQAFFHPFFYLNQKISSYLFANYCHPNNIGDILAIGAFTIFGVFLYACSVRFNKGYLARRNMSMYELTMSVFLMFVTILGVFLYNGRGTMLAFIGAFGVFILLALLKFPTRKSFLGVGILFLFSFGLLTISGISGDAWKELKTLDREIDVLTGESSQASSISTIIESNKRGFRMARANYLWGVGKGGYKEHALRFASEGTKDGYFLMLEFALNHYLQTIAEEGLGGLIYFIFLLVFALGVIRKLFKTESRFVFYYGASLFCAVLMFLSHGFIQHLLQRINISFILYCLMGLCVGVVSEKMHLEE